MPSPRHDAPDFDDPDFDDPDFDELGRDLLSAGVAPRHVVRAIIEISEHVEDIAAELIERGATPESAVSLARERIGAVESIKEQYMCQPQLKCWSHRHPQMARLIGSVEHALLLPAMPVSAMTAAGPAIARWCACVVLSAAVTASLLLVMQVTISNG